MKLLYKITSDLNILSSTRKDKQKCEHYLWNNNQKKIITAQLFISNACVNIDNNQKCGKIILLSFLFSPSILTKKSQSKMFRPFPSWQNICLSSTDINKT